MTTPEPIRRQKKAEENSRFYKANRKKLIEARKAKLAARTPEQVEQDREANRKKMAEYSRAKRDTVLAVKRTYNRKHTYVAITLSVAQWNALDVMAKQKGIHRAKLAKQFVLEGVGLLDRNS